MLTEQIFHVTLAGERLGGEAASLITLGDEAVYRSDAVTRNRNNAVI